MPERGPCFSGTSPHAFPKVPTWGPVWGNRLASQSWKYRPRARLAGCSIRSLEAMPWCRSWAVMPWWWLINVLTMDDNVRFSTDMPLSREDTRYPLSISWEWLLVPFPDMVSQAEGPVSRCEDRERRFVPSPAIIRRDSSPTFIDSSFLPHSHHPQASYSRAIP